MILLSATYGLKVWGSFNNTDIKNLKRLHARAGRIVYGLPWDTSAEDVLTRTGWDSLETTYKVRLRDLSEISRGAGGWKQREGYNFLRLQKREGS